MFIATVPTPIDFDLEHNYQSFLHTWNTDNPNDPPPNRLRWLRLRDIQDYAGFTDAAD